MARERKQAAIEAGKSMRAWGWLAYAVRDATICPNCGEMLFPGAASGTWDFKMVGVPMWDRREIIYVDVEVKAGNTSIPFSALREDQRLWATEKGHRPKWLWLCIGKNAVNAREKPRKTYFIHYPFFQGLEAVQTKRNRKSIPYDYVWLRGWELKWAGNGLWEMPEGHPWHRIFRET